MKTIKTVGIVGAGTMGSALAQKFSQEGFNVILADREMKFVEKGIKAIRTMLEEAVQKNVFTSEQIKNFMSVLTGTSDLNDLKRCDIIVEAIYEDFKVKSELFKRLSEIVSPDTILATNTSSFSVNELSSSVKNPERFIGLHFFYHAAKNRLVEIIPGPKTSDETLQSTYRFAMLSGKDPIFTKDAYGFAVNRFFVPWLNESVKLFEEGIASINAIESVCMKTFGIGMGPFALMNATGIIIAFHAELSLEVFGPSYKASNHLMIQVGKNKNWEIGDLNNVIVDPETEKIIRERMLGSVFFVCSQILETGICKAIDLNKGAKIGLRWKKGPVDLMKQYGEKEVRHLVLNYASLYKEKLPEITADKWEMEYVLLEKEGDRAIITMNRPEDLNALNEEVVKMLDEKFTLAENDPAIKTIFITGSGKAFVAGADIKFFVKNMKNHSLENIVEFTSFGQNVFEKIDNSKKKVVVILNGMALGGGLELALCGDVILCVPGATMSFPETGIGIYPGLGGTQRCALKIGKGLAKYLILTGKTLSAIEASEIGLVDEVVSRGEMFDILNGKKSIPASRRKDLSEKMMALSELYETNNYKSIINGKYSNGFIEKEEMNKLRIIMSYKAPIAMEIAEELIEQAKGPQSELEKLTTIFSTGDAMIGLTSIGKKVEYLGR